jgi:hypothetical protein
MPVDATLCSRRYDGVRWRRPLTHLISSGRAEPCRAALPLWQVGERVFNTLLLSCTYLPPLSDRMTADCPGQAGASVEGGVEDTVYL